MKNRHIDKVRKSAVAMTLPPDAGGITDMVEINGALHMIGGSAIYRVQLADEIDPERTNIAIPNTHQKVMSYGTKFPYVRQTLMQSRRLFKDKVLGSAFDYKAGINFSFDALKDLTAMYEMRVDLLARLEKAREDLKTQASEHRSLHVPAMGDMRGMTESFLQKADHVALDLFKIVRLFYGDEIGKGMFDGLHDLISKKFGKDDPFSQFLEAVLPLLKFVRNARNAVEHEDETKRIAVSDISLLPSGELNPPSIEIVHKETPQPSVALLVLMEHLTDQLALVFEVMIAQLCNVNVHPFGGLPLGVIEYDERMQQAYNCRYGYATRMGDQVVPFG